jgi:hypothetical protein
MLRGMLGKRGLGLPGAMERGRGSTIILIIGVGLKGQYVAGPVSSEDVWVTPPGIVDFFVERMRSLDSEGGMGCLVDNWRGSRAQL